ncbi:MAG: SMC-Scp complex subunit ScpB [Candidatus Moranbacteria bacterium]|jgi:segregation and condensation protein B|nr:SMC-Scp complex subunit ScpB [Candidatus Moranbacteria bacterium]
MEKEKIKSIIESILFARGEEISFLQLAKTIEIKKSEVISAVDELIVQYQEGKKGFGIIKNGENIQMVTNPDNAQFVERTIKKNLQETMSRTALEVLAIVAYRGPVSRADIEAIRGVNSSFTLRNLLMRGLIIKSTNENDQRGYLYNISSEFIKKMGIGKIDELPDYEGLSKDKRVESIINLNVEK